MSALAKPYISPEEYLEIERKAEFKSEYYHGEMFVMSGVSLIHNQISMNLIVGLSNQFRKRPCLVFGMELRVAANKDEAYYYPDVMALCAKPKLPDEQHDTLLNPSVVIEVLSSSTEIYDRGWKREQYRKIETLCEYVLASQDRMHIELYALQKSGNWLLYDFYQPDENLELKSVQAKLTLAEIYDKAAPDLPVDFSKN